MTRATPLLRFASIVGLAFVPVVTACGGSSDDGAFDQGDDGAFDDGGGAEGGAGGGGAGGPLLGGGAGGVGGDRFGQDGGGIAPQADECRKMDIVFVVDDSGSMKQEQDNLAANFPKFVDVIDAYKTKSGAELDYRLAVTTTDRGKKQGAFATERGRGAPKGCDPGPSRPWLERADGTISDFFTCRARAGTSGDNVERPLESVLLAVTDRITDGANVSSGTSFLRDDALLAFVAITDEDEGGTENEPARDVSEYPGLFDRVKGDRGRWAAAVIAGETKCSSKGLGNAAEAKRLKQFITDVGKNGVFASICTGDLTEGLTKALSTFDRACKDFPAGPK